MFKGKKKSKKDIETETQARIAAVEAVSEQKLAELRSQHADDLDRAYERSQSLATDLNEAVAAAMTAGAIATTGMHLLEATSSEVERLRGAVDGLEKLAAGQRNRVGALAATISALRYAEQTPQIARVLDAVDGFVDLIRQDADKLIAGARVASIEPDYDLPDLSETFSSLADEIEDDEPRTVEIDLSGLACASVAETDAIADDEAERSFFDGE